MIADSGGAVAAEYAFVLSFVALVAAAGMFAMGESLSNFFDSVGTVVRQSGCSMPETSSASGQANSNRCGDK
jgi:Flp pilus assembly pilin Flp